MKYINCKGSGPGNARERGMTLIEVLVTTVLISVGLLGVAALQLTSLRANQEAYVSSQASVLAADILDRMRANQQGLRTGQYAVLGAIPGVKGGTGKAGSNGGNDMVAWQDSITALLPGAPAGTVEVDLTGRIVTVTIVWGERANMTSSAAADQAAHFVTFKTRTEI